VCRRKKCLKPTFEAVEKRWLPSGLLPVVTVQTYRQAVVAVERVVRDLARSHDVSRASAALEAVASTFPNGEAQLAPVWNSDLAAFNPRARGSALMVRRRLLADLRADIVSGVSQGEFQFGGHGGGAGGGGGGGIAQQAVDSVTLVNNTGFDIKVTAFLNGTTRSITQTIAKNGSVPFNFNSATNNFISINVARTNGNQPPPRNGIMLNRPIGGYNGKSFTISVVQGSFSVNIA